MGLCGYFYKLVNEIKARKFVPQHRLGLNSLMYSLFGSIKSIIKPKQKNHTLWRSWFLIILILRGGYKILLHNVVWKTLGQKAHWNKGTDITKTNWGTHSVRFNRAFCPPPSMALVPLINFGRFITQLLGKVWSHSNSEYPL